MNNLDIVKEESSHSALLQPRSYEYPFYCRLISDLSEWTTLYAAGRLQKPVRVIKAGVNEEFNNALETNRRHALRIALLLMPMEFEEISLFQTIASLSYVGKGTCL